jgi:hypothetical protein
MGVSQPLTFEAGLKIAIIPISASQVARIAGVSHHISFHFLNQFIVVVLGC